MRRAKISRPAEAKKTKKHTDRINTANSFQAIALDWMKERKSVVEPAQHLKTLARPENDVFPWLCKRSIAQIDTPEILAVMKRIDGRGARFTAHRAPRTAHRVRSKISRVFRYAIKERKAKVDPAKDLIGATLPAVETHFASITEPAKVAEMLRAFDGFSGTFPVF